MPEIRFDRLINKHLGPLARKYNYKIKFIDHSDYPDPSVEDGEAEISSSHTLIYIMRSRFDYVLTIKPAGEPKLSEMSPKWILDALEIAFDIPSQDSQLGSFDEFLFVNVQLLNTYFKSFLIGDFSQWIKILEYFNKRRKENYFARTGKELPKYTHKELDEYIEAKKLQSHYP